MKSDTLRGRANAIAQLDRIMWMPGGLHTVSLDKGGKPHEITVRVDRETAATLQAELGAKLAGEHRPFFDFHHDEKEASAWPRGFVWQDAPAPGVYAEVEWSARGREAVEGKVYRAFSPAFYAQPLHGTKKNPARITGAPFCMGGLVNDPAFKQISPLWARNAAGAQPSSAKNKNNMNEEQKAALQAKLTELEQTLEALRAGNQSADTLKSIEDAEAEQAGIKLQLENDELRAKCALHDRQEAAQRKANAEAAVADAVKRGAIPSKDEVLQAKWTEQITKDPGAMTLLAALPGHPAMQARRITLGSTRGGAAQVEMLQEDIQDVLRAYAREQDHRKRGQMYKQVIAKRLDDLREQVLRADNTLGTVSGELIVQRTLELLTYELPVLSRITTDFSDTPLYNREVNTRIVTPPDIGQYHATNGYVVKDATTTDVPVKIDQHPYTAISFNSNELGGTFRKLFDEQSKAMMYALAAEMVDKLYAVITTTNFTGTPTDSAAINFDRRAVIAVGTAMTVAKNPLAGRTMLLNAEYYGNLMSDDAIVSLGANQRGEIITGNRLPMVHGFEIIEAANLPTTGNLVGFGMTQSALVMAARLPNDYASVFPEANGGGSVRTVTSPDIGLSVSLAKYIDHQKGSATQRVAVMFGVAKGQVAAGHIIRSGA